MLGETDGGAAAAGAIVLEIVVRLIGALWVFGAVALAFMLRRESALEAAVGKLETLAAALGTKGESPDSAADAAQKAWEERDDRQRRRWLAIQGVLLFVTGVSMLLLHVSAIWLIAALVAAQGVYFFWRERKSRQAPNETIAALAHPNQSTVNAGWFSLFAAALVWVAAATGRLHG